MRRHRRRYYHVCSGYAGRGRVVPETKTLVRYLGRTWEEGIQGGCMVSPLSSMYCRSAPVVMLCFAPLQK
jgi:hypothetical protein